MTYRLNDQAHHDGFQRVPIKDRLAVEVLDGTVRQVGDLHRSRLIPEPCIRSIRLVFLGPTQTRHKRQRVSGDQVAQRLLRVCNSFIAISRLDAEMQPIGMTLFDTEGT